MDREKGRRPQCTVTHHLRLCTYLPTVTVLCLPLPFHQTLLLSTSYRPCNHGYRLSVLVLWQRCVTSGFLQGSRPTSARSCRKSVSGDGGNDVVPSQTPCTANMMTLNSRCTVECVEAIKLRLVSPKQREMYHTSVVLSFIGYSWERISDSID